MLVKTVYPNYRFGEPGAIKSILDLVDHYYFNGPETLLYHERFETYPGSTTYNPFKITIKSKLFNELIEGCTNANWVDIENEFYKNLKTLLNVEYPRKISSINTLNNTVKAIIEQLELYLNTIQASKLTSGYSAIFDSILEKEDIVVKNDLQESELPKDSLILNFNYTSTAQDYFHRVRANIDTQTIIPINYIHGKIGDVDNPLIFGFGNELDSEYSKMELEETNEFFEYIKSFWYLKTSNYHNLIRFIDDAEYQIYILGHSCGLSDKTLLNMLFEHPNCKSIKIYYHGNRQKNNHKKLTQEISRHFRDKVAMRNKIVPLDKSSPMPQVE
jgi:hypothetical protein